MARTISLRQVVAADISRLVVERGLSGVQVWVTYTLNAATDEMSQTKTISVPLTDNKVSAISNVIGNLVTYINQQESL